MTSLFTPRPNAAPAWRMVLAQGAIETRLLLRNGEQVILTMIVPVALLVFLTLVPVIEVDEDPSVDFFAPGILALAVLSTSFTGQAIGTGFERRYAVLKWLGSTPLPRWGLLAGKTLAVLTVQAVQILVIVAVALGLGWSPTGSPLTAAVLVIAGTTAFTGLAYLLAGTLRAEATLALANLLYLMLLTGGGFVVPVDEFPDAVQPVLHALPAAALSDGLRAVLTDGTAMPWGELGILTAWAAVLLSAAAATFRWE